MREVVTELDLDVLIKPCPEGGTRYRRDIDEARLPVLVDPNTDSRHEGLRASLDHLLGTYAERSWLSLLLGRWPAKLSSRLASLARGDAGRCARTSRPAGKPLELYSFESSPFSRLVRERLCELELSYVLRSLGKQQLADYGPANARLHVGPYRPVAGSRREQLLQHVGKVQVPYLIDPNTGESLFESAKILAYLERTYAVLPLT